MAPLRDAEIGLNTPEMRLHEREKPLRDPEIDLRRAKTPLR